MEILPIDLGTMIASGATFMTALFGGIKLLISSSNRAIHVKIDGFKRETTERFDNISHTLAIVEDTTVRKAVIDSLRATVRGYIYYNKGLDNNTKILIDGQCERVIELADEMMTETFTPEVMEQFYIKLEECGMKNRQQVARVMGNNYLEQYHAIERAAMDEYICTLRRLTDDKIVNSKYARFRTATETFLHQLVGNTIVLAHNAEREKMMVV